MKIYIETYGCPFNKSDSERAAYLLKKSGFEIVDSEKEADLIIINTCIVKTPTENKILNRIRKLYKKKPLVIMGCLSQAYPEKIRKFGINFIGINTDDIVEAVKKTIEGKHFEKIDRTKDKIQIPSYSFSPVIEIIPISEGCLGACSYCATKLARGNLISYDPNRILEKIEKAVKYGKKEIWITSQDNSVYGFDIGINLVDLLEKVDKIEGKYWVRVGMMNPRFLDFIDPLIDIIKNSEHFFKFLHIPVQSGSNRILQLMNRGYTVEEFLKIAKKVKKAKITLSTDVIVGFPTETEEDFEKSLDLIKKIKPDFLNISRFWVRDKTPAQKLKQVYGWVIKERSRILTKLFRKISLENNKKWLNWKGEILIDEKGKNNTLNGRNIYYKPIVLNEGELGKFYEAKIIDYKTNYLIGKII